MTAQNKCKLDNLENGQIWQIRLGHISQDRIKMLVDSKSDNLNNLLAYEPCLKGKMTSKPFVGQRYGYVYLLRYKSEDFVRFKEFRPEVENQTDCKIKTLRSDQGGEYRSGEFLDHLKENGIVSQWNGLAERRNQTLLDMVRIMMSFSKLFLSF
ncbi:UNVERIFIED_CONTAM: hypothetical protein Scaly_2600900 [Sesamum calycinum]|uniref:Integrase catalytic domain-containing protein n=1 Tax=Sesamum calycinum TaxID=2727403 RepID=A0AAW2JE31_9LAMI